MRLGLPGITCFNTSTRVMILVTMSDELHYQDDSSLELPMADTAINDIVTTTSPDKPPRSMPKLPPALLIALVVLIIAAIAGGIVLVGKSKPKATPAQITINTQSLDAGTLTKLTNKTGSDPTKQQLAITPDTVFKNNVQVVDGISTNKNLSVGGDLSVSGNTNLQGPAVLDGNLAVRGALSVAGSLSAASLNVGSLTVGALTTSGNINLGGHLVPSGATPAVRTSTAAGNGTAVVSGNDTAGTITITTGSGSLSPGELVILNFTNKFSATPKAQLTAINGPAADMHVYATRSTGILTIETTTAAAPNTTYVFDYFISQ
jgi:cytoskeletal protein CcmA (bactofilin family)